MMRNAYLNEFWNDSCRLDELRRAIAGGATGATSNPPLMWKAIQAEAPDHWRSVVQQARENGLVSNDEDAAWALVRDLAVKAAALLKPVWQESGGRMGLFSVQVDPRRHDDTDFMVRQAAELNRLAPNLSIKIPVTQAGLGAVEELAARGLNTTATVSFTVPQVIAAAEAFGRGRARASARSDAAPVQCFAVVMVGRLDDHLRDVAEEEGIEAGKDLIAEAGVAVVKKAYQVFQERGYESRLLVGAMRGAYHISEFIGGDVVLTASPDYHDVFAGSAGELAPRLQEPVAPAVIEELAAKLPDFPRAYEEDGLTPEEFERFGPSLKTLNQFIQAFNDTVEFAGGL